MKIKKTSFKDLIIINHKSYKDKRGYFLELYKKKIIDKSVKDIIVVSMSQSERKVIYIFSDRLLLQYTVLIFFIILISDDRWIGDDPVVIEILPSEYRLSSLYYRITLIIFCISLYQLGTRRTVQYSYCTYSQTVCRNKQQKIITLTILDDNNKVRRSR